MRVRGCTGERVRSVPGARELGAWVLSGLVLAAQGAAAQTLGVAGDRFTVDGTPRFLTFISYFDALRAASLEADLDFVKGELGFDGIRIFPNWWLYDRDTRPCPSAQDDTLFDVHGGVRGDSVPASGPLARLLVVVREAGKRGLIVDLSFARETVPGGMAVEPYRRALQRTAFLLRGQRHVLFDLQNERDLDRPAAHLTPEQVRRLRDSVKDPVQGDPGRLVVASNTGTSPPFGSGADDPAGTVGFVKAARLDATAFHDPRGSGWELRVPDVVTRLRRAGKPVYLQEPTRWRVGDTSACGRPETADADGRAEHFRTALRNARAAGAAAWTFHTQRAFTLRTGWPSLRRQIEGLPAASAERELLIGSPEIGPLTAGIRQ